MFQQLGDVLLITDKLFNVCYTLVMPTKEERRQYNKSFYQSCIDKGLCPRCGKNIPVVNHRLCQGCIDYTTQKAKERLTRHRNAGLCMCGQPPVEGMRLCLKCQEHTRLSNKHKTVWARIKSTKLKLEVFKAYGGKCICCGERRLWALQIDHVFNNGARHKKELNCNGGRPIYRWAKENGFPNTLQLLCATCNYGKSINQGKCPHEVERYVSARNAPGKLK